MTDTVVLELLRQTFWISLKIGGPILAVALVIGVAIGLIQAITQIQEMTLTFVPKIVAVFLALLFSLPWIIEKLTTFTINLFSNIPLMIR